MQIGGWTGIDISLDQQTMDSFAPQEILLRDYQNTNQPEPPVALFFDYMPSGNGAQIHSEWKHCLPSGWVPTLREVVEIPRPDGSSFPANRYVVSKERDRELVLNWYQAHGRAVASESWAKFYLVAESIRMNRTDGALVQLTTHMTDGESPDAAQVRVMRLGSQLVLMLDRYIPR
jgi:EpsI family protein